MAPLPAVPPKAAPASASDPALVAASSKAAPPAEPATVESEAESEDQEVEVGDYQIKRVCVCPPYS